MVRSRRKVGELGTVKIHRLKGRVRGSVLVRHPSGKLIPIERTRPSEMQVRAIIERDAALIWSGLYEGFSSRTTIAEVATRWIDFEAKRLPAKSRTKTVEVFQSMLTDVILPRFGAEAASEIFPDGIADVAHYLEEPARCDAYFATMNRLMAYATTRGATAERVPLRLSTAPEAGAPVAGDGRSQLDDFRILVRTWRGKKSEHRGGARPNLQLLEDLLLISLTDSIRPVTLLSVTCDDVHDHPLGVRVRLGRCKRVCDSDRYPSDRCSRCLFMPVSDDAATILRRRLAEYVPNRQRLLFTTKKAGAHDPANVRTLVRAFREHHAAELKALGIDLKSYTLTAAPASD